MNVGLLAKRAKHRMILDSLMVLKQRSPEKFHALMAAARLANRTGDKKPYEAALREANRVLTT